MALLICIVILYLGMAIFTGLCVCRLFESEYQENNELFDGAMMVAILLGVCLLCLWWFVTLPIIGMASRRSKYGK